MPRARSDGRKKNRARVGKRCEREREREEGEKEEESGTGPPIFSRSLSFSSVRGERIMRADRIAAAP